MEIMANCYEQEHTLRKPFNKTMKNILEFNKFNFKRKKSTQYALTQLLSKKKNVVDDTFPAIYIFVDIQEHSKYFVTSSF